MLELISLQFVLQIANNISSTKEEDIPVRCKPEEWERVLGTIQQADCYQEQDTTFHIWYNITKNHILPDGNKRMGLACFITYSALVNVERILNDNTTLEELSIDIAKSEAAAKERVIAHLKGQLRFAPLGEEV